MGFSVEKELIIHIR